MGEPAAGRQLWHRHTKNIAPEQLLRDMLLQVFFSVHGEYQWMAPVCYNIRFYWLIGLTIDDEVWDHSNYSKNRDSQHEHAVVDCFFTEVITLADKLKRLSREHRRIKRVDQHFKPTITASSIVRMARILSAVPRGTAQ